MTCRGHRAGHDRVGSSSSAERVRCTCRFEILAEPGVTGDPKYTSKWLTKVIGEANRDVELV